MNNNSINQWQAIWQSQQAVPSKDSDESASIAGLIQRLGRLEKKQYRLNRIKTVALVLILLPYSIYLVTMVDISSLALFGLGWILLITTAFMIFYWKKQFRLNGLDFSLSSNNFLEHIFENLEFQKKMFQLYFPVFAFLLLMGVNIIYLGLVGPMSVQSRIMFHLSASLFIVLATVIGLRIRKIRFSKEYQPLIDEVNTIQQDLKGDNL